MLNGMIHVNDILRVLKDCARPRSLSYEKRRRREAYLLSTCRGITISLDQEVATYRVSSCDTSTSTARASVAKAAIPCTQRGERAFSHVPCLSVRSDGLHEYDFARTACKTRLAEKRVKSRHKTRTRTRIISVFYGDSSGRLVCCCAPLTCSPWAG